MSIPSRYMCLCTCMYICVNTQLHTVTFYAFRHCKGWKSKSRAPDLPAASRHVACRQGLPTPIRV